MPLGYVASLIAQSADPGAMVFAVGLGWWGAVLITLATLTTNFVNIYMSALAFKSLFPAATDRSSGVADRRRRRGARPPVDDVDRAVREPDAAARRRPRADRRHPARPLRGPAAPGGGVGPLRRGAVSTTPTAAGRWPARRPGSSGRHVPADASRSARRCPAWSRPWSSTACWRGQATRSIAPAPPGAMAPPLRRRDVARAAPGDAVVRPAIPRRGC